MNKIHRLMHVLLIPLLAVSCTSEGSCPAKELTDYQDIRKCWSENGNFSSLVILVDFHDGYIPYFISHICDTEELFDNIHGIPFNGKNPISLIDDSAADNDSEVEPAYVLESPLYSNYTNNLPLPKDTSKVYYITSNISRERNGGYVFNDIKNFLYTGKILEDIVHMDCNQRMTLTRTIRKDIED